MEVGRCTEAGISAASVALLCLLEAGGRNCWRISVFFVIVTDSSRRESPGFYFSCVLLHGPSSSRQPPPGRGRDWSSSVCPQSHRFPGF